MNEPKVSVVVETVTSRVDATGKVRRQEPA
jgi:hypothetical protein